MNIESPFEHYKKTTTKNDLMQVHRHKKRFYNHAHDAIIPRLWGVLRYASRKIATVLTGRQKPFFSHNTEREDWCVSLPFVERSLSPVITWIGHATFLIQINGINILTDPVYGDISRFFKRYVYPTTTIDQLPPIDVIIISHNHRDHCDAPTLKALAKLHNPLILVPHGNKKLAERLGFSKNREMDWWQEQLIDTRHGLVRCSFLPAAHWTGRGIFDTNHSLWGSWLIQANTDSVYFAGDTAYGEHFSQIGQAFPSIDVALMPIAPAEPRSLMQDSHIDHHEAIQGFIDLGAHHFIPMHWGTFHAGLDTFIEPLKKLEQAWLTQTTALSHKSWYPLKFGERWLYPHSHPHCSKESVFLPKKTEFAQER